MDKNDETDVGRDDDFEEAIHHDNHHTSDAPVQEPLTNLGLPLTRSNREGMEKWKAAAHILATGAIRAAQASKRGTT